MISTRLNIDGAGAILYSWEIIFQRKINYIEKNMWKYNMHIGFSLFFKCWCHVINAKMLHYRVQFVLKILCT